MLGGGREQVRDGEDVAGDLEVALAFIGRWFLGTVARAWSLVMGLSLFMCGGPSAWKVRGVAEGGVARELQTMLRKALELSGW